MQQLRRAEHVVDERAVGAEGDVLPRAQLGKIPGARIGGEGALAAARIADGDRAGHFKKRAAQHGAQLREARGAEHRHIRDAG